VINILQTADTYTRRESVGTTLQTLCSGSDVHCCSVCAVLVSNLQGDAVPFIPVSGWHGDNLVERSSNMDWYKVSIHLHDDTDTRTLTSFPGFVFQADGNITDAHIRLSLVSYGSSIWSFLDRVPSFWRCSMPSSHPSVPWIFHSVSHCRMCTRSLHIQTHSTRSTASTDITNNRSHNLQWISQPLICVSLGHPAHLIMLTCSAVCVYVILTVIV